MSAGSQMLLSVWFELAVALRKNSHLQDNHYRPEDSDTCLLCDCYPVGSFSRACDRESGQCQCKPGVIGRQCDRCDNPFAEVTPNGCEGQNTLITALHQVPFFIIGTNTLDIVLILSSSSPSCSISLSNI